MILWFKTLSAFAEDLVSVPSAHTVTPIPWDPLPSLASLGTKCATHKYMQKTLIHLNLKKN